MTGVRGLLDDAQGAADDAAETTVALRDQLADIAGFAVDTVPAQVAADLAELRDLAEALSDGADNLNHKIEQQRNALRRG